MDTKDLPPLLKRIMQLHDDVVSRDKMIIGTLNIVSGLIAMQETDEQEKKPATEETETNGFTDYKHSH